MLRPLAMVLRRGVRRVRGGGCGAYPDFAGPATIRTARDCATRRGAWSIPTPSSSPATEADPEEILRRTFEETDGYDEIVLL